MFMPRVPSSFFSFRPVPSPRLGSSRFACFDLFPRPPGRGMSGLMSICRCWLRVGLFACHRPRAALSLIARSLFPA